MGNQNDFSEVENILNEFTEALRPVAIEMNKFIDDIDYPGQ